MQHDDCIYAEVLHLFCIANLLKLSIGKQLSNRGENMLLEIRLILLTIYKKPQEFSSLFSSCCVPNIAACIRKNISESCQGKLDKKDHQLAAHTERWKHLRDV